MASQTAAILGKNLRLHWRRRFLLKDLALVAFLVVLVAIMAEERSNYITIFYLSIVIVNYSRFVVMALVEEKQSKQKEVQAIMGLAPAAYYLAWVVYLLLAGLLLIAVLVIGLSLTGNLGLLFRQDDPTLLASYLLMFLSTFTFSLAISVVFDRTASAGKFSVFFQLVISNLYWLILNETVRNSTYLNYLFCIFPQSCYNMGLMLNLGLPLSITAVDICVAQAVITVFYLVLYLYLGQIYPNQYGTQKHPLFFVSWLTSSQRESLIAEDNRPFLDEGDVVLEDRRDSVSSSSVVRVTNFSKKFGSFEAVKGITFDINERSMMCLLGHNGAGKSTTIHALTGLLPKTGGQIKFKELNVETDMDQIRKRLGICLQTDVLYDQLTLEEQLSLFASIKEVSPDRVDQAVERAIQVCGLEEQRGKPVKTLSGGNKRKLSLGCALVGDSSIIFLDEPTSGMDPESRRSIFQILQQLKAERSIVLTTHHLEEAEELADSIAILAKGRLLAVGTPAEIKSKFGIGYHLILGFRESQEASRCLGRAMQLLCQFVQRPTHEKQSASNVLKFLIPESCRRSIPEIIERMEELPGCKVSLQASTLEDAFINIGTDQEAFLRGELEANSKPEFTVPDFVFQRQPQLSLGLQVWAMLSYRWRISLRSPAMIFGYLYPMVYVLVGAVICLNVFEDSDPQNWPMQTEVFRFFLVWGFVFNSNIYTAAVVRCVKNKVRFGQSVMGLQPIAHWVAIFLHDFIVALALWALFGIFVAVAHPNFISTRMLELTMLYLAFSAVMLLFCYCWSFSFTDPKIVYGWFPTVNLLFFFGLQILLLQLYMSKFNKESEVLNFLLMASSPFYNLYAGASISSKSSHVYSAFALQFAICGALLAYFETVRSKLRDPRIIGDEQDEEVPGPDVLAQNQLCMASQAPIVISGVSKKYSNGFIAVRNNNLAVERHEILGLLGPNGAGKSTTFSIATASLCPTQGEVRLTGKPIRSCYEPVFIDVGMCPQFNVLEDCLTVEQHLQHFAILKGNREPGRLIQFYISALQMEDYRLVKSSQLSGGNKRKLCVAIAMIGNPSLYFFDQPSTGVDPVSRRCLWEVLNCCAKTAGASVLLTTHSMKEADSLCSRIAILIRGRLYCIGTPLELKERFAKGYRLKLLLDGRANPSEVAAKLKDKFGSEVQLSTSKKELGATITSCRIGEAFGWVLRELQDKGLAKDFTLSENSLEQVFFEVSRLQEQVQLQRIEEPWKICCVEWGQDGVFCCV